MEDPPIIIYDEEDVQDGIHSCSKSLIEKKLQFFFDEPKDADRILKGSPWIFRNAWLSLRRWERGQVLPEIQFSLVPLKIQIWGLPLHCRTTKMGFKIGACMGEVKESDVYETKEKGTFIKIQVIFNVNKPLKSGINVGSMKDGISWADFQYERLPQFCYICGKVGHDEDGCKSQQEGEKEGDKDASEFGPWLRASQIGRKLLNKDAVDDSKKRQNSLKKHNATLPSDFLQMMSSLTVTNNDPSSTLPSNDKSTTSVEQKKSPFF
ncbi:Zinc finger, CCHC-type [Sesbania bispinosa]|nr:Zinc finger, CCHC-type [Sesbania bispinosa]